MLGLGLGVRDSLTLIRILILTLVTRQIKFQATNFTNSVNTTYMYRLYEPRQAKMCLREFATRWHSNQTAQLQRD